MGLPSESGHPAVREAIERMKQAAQDAGIAAGMTGGWKPRPTEGGLAQGFQFMSLGNLNGLLTTASQGLVEKARNGLAG